MVAKFTDQPHSETMTITTTRKSFDPLVRNTTDPKIQARRLSKIEKLEKEYQRLSEKREEVWNNICKYSRASRTFLNKEAKKKQQEWLDDPNRCRECGDDDRVCKCYSGYDG